MSEEPKVTMYFLDSNPEDNRFIDKQDIHTDTCLLEETMMLSNTIIVVVQIETMDDLFINRVRAGGKEDDAGTSRKQELTRLKEKQKTEPKN